MVYNLCVYVYIRKGDSISGVPLCGGPFGRNCAVWLQVGLGYRKKNKMHEKSVTSSIKSRGRGESEWREVWRVNSDVVKRWRGHKSKRNTWFRKGTQGRTNEMLKKVPHETQFPLEMVSIIISFHHFWLPIGFPHSGPSLVDNACSCPLSKHEEGCFLMFHHIVDHARLLHWSTAI